MPIADAEDKAILDADLASEPWYGLDDLTTEGCPV